MPVIPFKGVPPKIDDSAFIAPDAWVTGQTTIHKNVSVFFNVSIRGDLMPIEIHEGSNVQENSVIHTTNGFLPCIVGPGTTVGHSAILHGCEIKGFSIIGMNATVLDNAVINKYCIIGANTLVPMRMEIPEGSLVIGTPAKVVRKLTDAERAQIDDSYQRYIEVGREYKKTLEMRYSS